MGTYFFSSGNVFHGNWLNGNKEGLGMTMLTDKTKYEGYYKENKKSGKGTYYYSNGQTKSTGSFLNGKKTGDWNYYDEMGEITKIVEYADGKEVRRIK